MMKAIIVGNGAREHVVAERLAEDCELYSIMSKKNPAIARLSKKYWITDIEDSAKVSSAIGNGSFDIAFSSPDATLAAGVSDVFVSKEIPVASPTKAASRIEWDKAYARNLMKNHSIPGLPAFAVISSEEDALSFIKETGEVAVKPVGLTGGKGVKIMGEHLKDEKETLAYALSLIKKDGSVVLEERLNGQEFTCQAFCDGTHISAMPPVQDHKRAFEGDSGPNTGGMGSYSTGKNLPFLKEKDIEDAGNIMRRTIEAMKKEGNPFKGVLYGQFMATGGGPKVIEFNARFGDPEAMNVVPLLKNSFADVLAKIAEGNLGSLEFSSSSTVVKYVVPDGYPDNPVKNREVGVDEERTKELGAKVYYASVYENEGKIFTTGSRAFGMLGVADSIEEAEQIAEKACSAVSGPLWHRKDIGTKELIEKKVRHMKSLRGGA